MNTLNDILERLFQYYNVVGITELADKMGITQPTISKWKARDSISAVKKKCRELGIYSDIFGDIGNQNIQYVHSNNGNNTQNGDNIVTASTQHDDEIEPAVFEVFKRAYRKATINEDKLDEFISYLLKFK